MTQNATILFPWCILATCWLLFFRATHLAGKQHALSFTACPDKNAVAANLIWHIRGLLFLGIIPVSYWLSSLPHALDAAPIFQLRLNWWVLVIALAAVYTGYRQAGKTDRESPLILRQETILGYLPIRMLYIISYELFFRGLLLFETLKITGPVMAVLINTMLYFLSHIYSNRKELLGTLALGPLLCLSSIGTGSVAGAILIHLSLTLSYELSVLRAIPNTTKQAI